MSNIDNAQNTEQKFNCSSVDFNSDLVLNDGNLDVKLSGRLDTINATTLLALYRDIADKNKLRKISVDCEGTEYVASAGLRVMLIMCKSLKEKIEFSVINYSKELKEIFDVTGFSEIFGIG